MNLKAILAASAIATTPLAAQRQEPPRFPSIDNKEQDAPHIVHPHHIAHLPIHAHIKRLTNAGNFPYQEREVIFGLDRKYVGFGIGAGIETEPHAHHKEYRIVNHPVFVVTVGVHR
jgi:hypothetical protein